MNDAQFKAFVDHAIGHAAKVNPPFIIAEKDQEKRLNNLKENLNPDKFFFIVNLKNFCIEDAHGIYEALGYMHLSMRDYLSITDFDKHPILQHTSQIVIEDITAGKWALKFNKHKYIVKQMLRHANGAVRTFKRTSSVWQQNNKNQVTRYLNEFDFFDDEPAPTKPFTRGMKGNAYEFEADIFKRGQQRAINELIQIKQIFTAREFHRILIPIAEGKTTKEIAEALSTSQKTTTPERVLDIQKEIIRKFKKHFGQDFTGGIQGIVKYFKGERLID